MARLLGKGAKTIHWYLKYEVKDSTLSDLNYREETSVLKAFLTEMGILLPNADPDIHNGTRSHHLLANAGDDAQSNSTVSGV